MVTKFPTPKQVARAWNKMPFEYGSRRALDKSCYEIYCHDTRKPISETSVKVLARTMNGDAADARAKSLDNDARAKSVIQLFRGGK